jgi:aminoglycoside 3-N-acetyltransferase
MTSETPATLATRASLAADLAAIGVAPGMTLIVHSSLSRIGFVLGGAETVIHALLDALGPRGNLLMPTLTGQLTDPAGWIAPPVPEDWHDRIRAEMPAFDPARTPTRNMGAIPELFRTWPGVHRSHHPIFSCAAHGPDAAALTADHALAWARGPNSPLGGVYARDGTVLLIGVGYDRNSSLHLGETKAIHRRVQKVRMPVARGGVVVWEEHDDAAADRGEFFPRIGADFDASGAVTIASIGAAESRFMRQRALVDFAAAWIDRELARDRPQESSAAGIS